MQAGSRIVYSYAEAPPIVYWIKNTMKKEYISPMCKAIKIEAQDILAGSPTIGEGYSDPSQPGLSKFNNFEDEEDEFNDEEF